MLIDADEERGIVQPQPAATAEPFCLGNQMVDEQKLALVIAVASATRIESDEMVQLRLARVHIAP